jgi:hypothetical protein
MKRKTCQEFFPGYRSVIRKMQAAALRAIPRYAMFIRVTEIGVAKSLERARIFSFSVLSD